MSWKKEIKHLELRKFLAKKLGGKEKIKRQHDAGRLTVRERIDYLVDRGSFEEIGILAGNSKYDDNGELISFTPSNSIIGNSGSGQLAKMVNQICIAGLLQGLSEAINFAQKVDLDVEKVIGVIKDGAASSWQMQNRYKTMANDEFNFGFAAEWMRKDLKICLDQANEVGARLPITAIIDQFYSNVISIGGKRWDTSSLIKLLR